LGGKSPDRTSPKHNHMGGLDGRGRLGATKGPNNLGEEALKRDGVKYEIGDQWKKKKLCKSQHKKMREKKKTFRERKHKDGQSRVARRVKHKRKGGERKPKGGLGGKGKKRRGLGL